MRELLVGVREPDLADGGRGLGLLELEGAFGQPELVAAERDRARRHEHDILSRAHEAGHVVQERGEPVALETPRRAVGEQRRADLDHEASGPLPLGADGSGQSGGGIGHQIWPWI